MVEPAGHSVVDVDNPFSPTAVARITERESDAVTVRTPAIREALSYLDAYLTHHATPAGDAEPVHPGTTICLLGDYGTGKTHLAVELLARARRIPDAPVHAIYLDAPADSFVSLNRRFLAMIRRDELRETLARHFVAVVGSPHPGSPEIGRSAEPGIGRSAEPGIGRPGALSAAERAFVSALRTELAPLTSSPSFALALALLLRPELENAVWEWLMGHPPGPALLAHDLAAAPDIEASAIEAMGVVARVYGRGAGRLVMVLDEADKVLSASSRSAGMAMVRFGRLLDVFASASAFLVIAGLPDLLQVLDPGIRQRLGPIVRMSALSNDDVERFVCETQLRAFGEARLAPFTPEVVRYLTNLADGTPRRVVRLCFHLYQRAAATQSPVTHAMVRDVVRAHFGLANMQDVRAEVRRVLNAEGWFYQQDHLIGSMRNVPVGFWIPLDERQAGCVVILADSVLKAEEVEDLGRQVVDIRAEVPDSETILVVVGHLAAEFAAELSDAFGREPIAYEPRSFADELSAALKASMRRLEEATGADALTSVRQRVERIHRQQANTARIIEQLSYQVDEVRTAVDQGLRPRGAAFPGAARLPAAPGAVGEDRPVAPVAVLPARVGQILDEARRVVGEFARFDELLRDSFAPRTPQSPDAPPESRIRLLRSREALRALGTSVLLQQLVEAFRGGVEDWYVRRPATPRPDHQREIVQLCDAYDAICEYLPLFELEALVDVAVLPRVGGEPRDKAGIARFADVRAIFDGLGARVREAVS
jgi:Cdc6-like AAA superfamily ATPase